MNGASQEELLAQLTAMQAQMEVLQRELSIQQSGSGGVAQSSGAAAGAGGVAMQGDVEGGIHLDNRQDNRQINTDGDFVDGDKITNIRQTIADPVTQQIIAAEENYLRGLYAECNELRLAQDGPVDAQHGLRPRLQRVYVELNTTTEPQKVEQVLERAGIPIGETPQALAKLRGLLGESDLNQLLQIGRMEGVEEEFSPRDRHKVMETRQEAEGLVGRMEKALGLAEGAWTAARRPLSVVEALSYETHLVILGDPGSGKSTVTKRLAGALASVGLDDLPPEDTEWGARITAQLGGWRLPVRMELSEWARHLPSDAPGVAADLINACVRKLAETTGLDGEKKKAHLLAYLTGKGSAPLPDDGSQAKPQVLLLLDGLDEVADVEKRKIILAAIGDFVTKYPAVPLLITCRERPYRGQPHYQLPLPDYLLAPLGLDDVESFLTRWHQELVWARLYTETNAASARQRLWTAINDPNRDDLREMAGTPLLLTMMARVNYSHGLPESRATLYELYTKQLLWEWERQKQDEQGQPTNLESCLLEANVPKSSLERALNQLAYQVHGLGSGQDSVEIPRSEIREALEGIHPGPEEAAAAWAVRVLGLIDDRSGLIYATEQRRSYRFSHRTFQEYLAARALASGNFQAKYREKLDQEQWREAIFLALGYQTSVLNDYDSPLRVFYQLLPDGVARPADQRAALLLGEAYTRLLGPNRARQTEDKRMADAVIKSIPARLTQLMQQRDAPPRQRLDAGLLLDDLAILPEDLDDFVSIPAQAQLGYDFEIAAYPVTNAQFRCFFEAGGYAADRPWWTEEAVKDIERRSYNKGWREGPRYWDDARFNKATQPVVGVSWYEAVAYAAWLSEQMHQQGSLRPTYELRLPTGDEWMRAASPPSNSPHFGGRTVAAASARSRGRAEDVYPWGSTEFDPARANKEESGLGQTTPVHMYPDGRTAEGVWDLAGNVWEWLLAEPGDLKGGSWYHGSERATASARDRSVPNSWNYNIGCRLVCVPISRVAGSGF
ncbi:MAG: hypothetical protein DWI57_11040 [Chloroflexi bacterium]|nr:MAG: hypothetical protein DWI57_11040 [Chloroflexota bacterium]